MAAERPDAAVGKSNTAAVRSAVGVRRQHSPPSAVAMTTVPSTGGGGERPCRGERGGATGDVGYEDDALLATLWTALAALLCIQAWWQTAKEG